MEFSMTAALLAGETVIDRPIISHHGARRESSVPGKLPTTGRLIAPSTAPGVAFVNPLIVGMAAGDSGQARLSGLPDDLRDEPVDRAVGEVRCEIGPGDNPPQHLAGVDDQQVVDP